MTLYDHFYGPPPWTRWLNGLGWALALWLFFWPQPYLPLLIAVGLLPPLYLVLSALWPGSFTLDEESEDFGFGRRLGAQAQSLSGLWVVPSMDIGLRALLDTRLMDVVWPFLLGVGLAVLMTLVCARVDRQMRGWWMTFNLLFCLSWSWGGVVLANVLLDRTPGSIVVAEVTHRRFSSDDGPQVELRLPDGKVLDNMELSSAAYDGATIGSRLCVEVNPGAFGWRSAYIADCVGPLRELKRSGPPH